MLAETFIRPADFDLSAFWKSWCHEYETRPSYITRVRLAPSIVPLLHFYLGPRSRRALTTGISAEKDDWVTMELQFESLMAARTCLLGMGSAVEVMEPEPLRKSVVDFAQQIVELYQEKGSRAVESPA